MLVPFPSLFLALWGVTPMPKAASAWEAVCCLGMVGLHTTPWRSVPCLAGFRVLSLWVLLWAAGSWLSGVPLLGRQVSPSTVSPGAVVRDRNATTFAMPPSKGIRALDFSVVLSFGLWFAMRVHSPTTGVGVPPVLHLGLCLAWPGASLFASGPIW